MRKLVLLCVVALALGGCGLYTKYQRPMVDDVVNRLSLPANAEVQT